MRRLLPLALAALVLPAAPLAAPATAPQVSGDYDSPLGRLRIDGDGTSYRGTLLAPAPPCRFKAGEEVLRGTLLDDSLAGELRLCQSGCAAPEAWARGVLLVGSSGLAGAVHVAPGCSAPIGRNGGVTLDRVAGANSGAVPPPRPAVKPAAAPAAPAAPSGPDRRARARELLRDGAAWLAEGNFERARARFEEAVAVDDRLPEAYNGVGVTWRMRNDFPRALQWYKRALAVDPDFGDAYYNMACVYALEGQPDLALRYLQIAAVNGYATAEGIGEDPDLASLRELPAYRALVRARM
jgi:hypothetical protein